MSSIRDPLADHLITPQNSALILSDYQPDQVEAVRSMDQDLLVENIRSTVKLAKLYGVPVVHSTANVASGQQEPTIPRIAELLEDDPPIDRTSLNAWEDEDSSPPFERPAGASSSLAPSGRRSAWPFLPSMRSARATRSIPSSTRSVARPPKPIGPASSASLRPEASPSAGSRWRAELQRDWAREETVAGVVEIVLTERC